MISPRELVIFDLRPEEEGFYFCMAKNELGEITSHFGQLNVWSESTNTVEPQDTLNKGHTLRSQTFNFYILFSI